MHPKPGAVGAACVQNNGARATPPPSFGSARACPNPSTCPRAGRAVSSCVVAAHFLFAFCFLFVRSSCSSISTPPRWLLKTRAMCVCALRPAGRKKRILWVFFCLAPFPTSSDSDRGPPPMRGVDSRGGGLSGNSGNPPPAGGRGRGMVLPAWLVAQQNAQMAGPVSFFLLLQPGRALALTEVKQP